MAPRNGRCQSVESIQLSMMCRVASSTSLAVVPASMPIVPPTVNSCGIMEAIICNQMLYRWQQLYPDKSLFARPLHLKRRKHPVATFTHGTGDEQGYLCKKRRSPRMAN